MTLDLRVVHLSLTLDIEITAKKKNLKKKYSGFWVEVQIFFFKIYLFIHERLKERERERAET